MSYAFKHLVAALLSPLTVSLLLTLVAVVLALCRRARLARALLIASAASAYLGSLPLTGDLLLAPLEARFPPLRSSQLPAQVGFIVALGSDYSPHDDVPITAELDATGLARIVEAVRLQRQLPGSRLIASGGAPQGLAAPAEGYARLARDLGVEPSSMLVLATGLDTHHEAMAVADVVGSAEVILVTSAYNMPRAMVEFQRAGIRVIAAPTGQQSGGLDPADWRSWLPNSSGLRKGECALHEYLGLMAQHVG
jgi:uncharacterized SAM-binding protein YcdF (DUF218 family)